MKRLAAAVAIASAVTLVGCSTPPTDVRISTYKVSGNSLSSLERLMKARCSARLSGDSATGLSVARVLALARKEADMRSLAQVFGARGCAQAARASGDASRGAREGENERTAPAARLS